MKRRARSDSSGTKDGGNNAYKIKLDGIGHGTGDQGHRAITM